MGIIFTFSNQIGKTSSKLSSSIASKLVEVVNLNKELTEKEKKKLVANYNYAIRKLAHYSIYLVGGILILSFLHNLSDKKWKVITLTILFGILYASSDEIHQYFVSGRDARVTDVCIDTIGVITGVVLYEGFVKIRRMRKKRKEEILVEEKIWKRAKLRKTTG